MSTPFDFFQYRDQILAADGVKMTEIADVTGTPVYVYSANAFLSPLRELQRGLQGIDHVICFAVKSNSNVAILKLLADAGAGMDLVSGGELFRAGLAGAPAGKIVFSGVGKTPGEILQALEYGGGKGIFSFNVESVSELEMISAVAAQAGRKAPVAVRFNPDVDAKTHPYISTGLKKNKFGMTRAEILEIARRIRKSPADFAGVDLQGVSIHIGSQLLSLSPLDDAFGRVTSLVKQLDALLPKPISYVDLGGGVGITYRNEKTPPLKKYCELIRKHFGPGKSSVGRPLKILLEPGRILSGNAGVLLTEVLHRKSRREKDFLIVDAAMNDLIRPSLYGSYHEIVPVEKKRGAGTAKKTDIVGPVCETGDCLASDRKVSTKLAQGDLLAILSAGAYGFAMSGNYNSRPRPAEVLVENGKFRVIRERESYEDLIRGENWGDAATQEKSEASLHSWS